MVAVDFRSRLGVDVAAGVLRQHTVAAGRGVLSADRRYSRKLPLMRPVAWTFVFALLYAAAAILLFLQAMMGRPLVA